MRLEPMIRCLLAAISISTLCSASDWTQWRGPNRDGLSPETGLLQQWPQGGPSLVWRATGLGEGFSSVSIVADRIYTTGDRGGACYVHGLNRTDGKLLWSAPLGKAGAPGWGGFAGPRGTPTVDGDLLYVMGQYGELACFKTADGAKVWERHMSTDFGGERPEWGYSESVLIDGDQAVCTPGGPRGAIVALDKRTGRVLWQTKDFTDPAHYSSLVCAEIAGVKQYVQLTADNVVGVAPDGQVLWRIERKGKTAVIPTPIVKGNKVYVTSGYGVGSNLFEVERADGKFRVRQVYAERSIASHHGGVVLVDDHVYGYCDSRGWTCQELATGKLKWTEKRQVGKGSVVYADGRLYLRAEDDGIVALIEATADGYKETGRFVQPGFGKPKTWPHPVVAGKRLYLRDQDQLLCYDVQAR
ncbi:MAG TPA: PQQ-like beta-propeller repeat protein [Sedimentisphaerales bacterium]|nr:PQQ-like beta-propeller repeat protein [Sedimentisphaerales bacterium]HRS11900.1 PQQ-like beta-propeller repeat protein [Sedimentisphaerales bacterium]HRV48577.1 PQQ-like beta-propeller repeat protein [Sedimentisphaerales bacterium]